jgi:hypothetical protein
MSRELLSRSWQGREDAAVGIMRMVGRLKFRYTNCESGRLRANFGLILKGFRFRSPTFRNAKPVGSMCIMGNSVSL